MKKTRKQLSLHRETLLRLSHGDLTGIRAGQEVAAEVTGDLCTNPSCIDGCPTVFTCDPTIIEEA